ncbi:MAG: hypothetical protein ACRDH5_18885 [bacterium]
MSVEAWVIVGLALVSLLAAVLDARWNGNEDDVDEQAVDIRAWREKWAARARQTNREG